MEAATLPDIEKKIREETASIISRHEGVFERPPVNVPSRKIVDGPIMGIGDVGVTISGPPACRSPGRDKGYRSIRVGRRSATLESERFTIKTAVGECIHIAPNEYLSSKKGRC